MFEIGQTVFLRMNHARSTCLNEATVMRVGRKWVQLEGHYRFDKETLVLDGGGYSSPGRVYLSVEDFEREQEDQRVWRIFCDRVDRHRAPAASRTREAASAIGIELEERP